MLMSLLWRKSSIGGVIVNFFPIFFHLFGIASPIFSPFYFSFNFVLFSSFLFCSVLFFFFCSWLALFSSRAFFLAECFISKSPPSFAHLVETTQRRHHFGYGSRFDRDHSANTISDTGTILIGATLQSEPFC